MERCKWTLGKCNEEEKSKRINFIRPNEHSVQSYAPKTIGDTLNKYLASIGHPLEFDIPEAVNATFSDYLDPLLHNSFFFDRIIPRDTETDMGLLWTIMTSITGP